MDEKTRCCSFLESPLLVPWIPHVCVVCSSTNYSIGRSTFLRSFHSVLDRSVYPPKIVPFRLGLGFEEATV